MKITSINLILTEVEDRPRATAAVLLDNTISFSVSLTNTDDGLAFRTGDVVIHNPDLLLEMKRGVLEEYTKQLNEKAKNTIPEGPVKHLHSFRRKH